MAVRFGLPFVQWTNGNSVVEAGAKLYFYTTGTSTPKNTYSDSDLTTPNANPVVADSNGKFGDIFLDAGEYKVILKDADDATLWTADPVGDSFEDMVVSGTFAIVGEITPAQITANQNNYSPSGGASTTAWRISSDAARDISGIDGGTAGRFLILHNVGSFGITLKDEDSNSSAANRFALTADIALAPENAVMLRYDASSARWRVVNSQTPRFIQDVTISYTDDGAGGGPYLILARVSESQAADDVIGVVLFDGMNSLGESVTYAQIFCQVMDPTAGSEDSRLIAMTRIAGVYDHRFYVGNGVYMAGPTTGGDPGAGKINAADYQKNGAQIPIQRGFESSEQTITQSSVLTIAHGLGVVPKELAVYLRCKTAEHGHQVNDEVLVTCDVGNNRSITIAADATNLYVSIGTTAYQVLNRSTSAVGAITIANWRILARAYAA